MISLTHLETFLKVLILFEEGSIVDKDLWKRIEHATIIKLHGSLVPEHLQCEARGFYRTPP